jgi:hypothetical protein
MPKEIKSSIEIAAAPEEVFRVLSDFPDYPSWNPFIVSITGEPREGEGLVVITRPPGSIEMRMNARIAKLEEPRELRWKTRLGLPGLFDGEDIFSIEPSGEGRVSFTHKKVFKGIFSPFFSKKLKDTTTRGFDEMNQALKRRVEENTLIADERCKRDAPVTAFAEIEIAAPVPVVWSLIVDVASWPGWNPDVKKVTFPGDLAEGSTFSWKAGTGTITSTLRRMVPGKVVAWTGKTLGIKAVHVWKLERRDEKTLVRTEESWEGLMVRIFRGPLKKKLQSSLDNTLLHLKKAAEKE